LEEKVNKLFILIFIAPIFVVLFMVAFMGLVPTDGIAAYIFCLLSAICGFPFLVKEFME
jgi:hypothetical protein